MHDEFSLFGTRRLPVIRQATAAECGLACLAMIGWYHGARSDLGELRRKHAISLRGADLATLLNVAKQLDLGGRAVRCELNELHQLRMPAMLHADFNHFVVLKKLKGRHFIVHDPAIGERKLNAEEMSRLFTGVAVEFTPTEQFKPKAAPRKLSLFSLIRNQPGCQLFGIRVQLARTSRRLERWLNDPLS
jgi:ATP-binding cassette, subfamily B, bacterial CvaB/MchF/RaxB